MRPQVFETGVLWTTAFEFASKTAMGRQPTAGRQLQAGCYLL